jgi:hypothetical protein
MIVPYSERSGLELSAFYNKNRINNKMLFFKTCPFLTKGPM